MKIEVNAFELLRLIPVKAEEAEFFYTHGNEEGALKALSSLIETAGLLKSCLEKGTDEEAELTNKN